VVDNGYYTQAGAKRRYPSHDENCGGPDYTKILLWAAYDDGWQEEFFVEPWGFTVKQTDNWGRPLKYLIELGGIGGGGPVYCGFL
jgi:hypothetical protein